MRQGLVALVVLVSVAISWLAQPPTPESQLAPQPADAPVDRRAEVERPARVQAALRVRTPNIGNTQRPTAPTEGVVHGVVVTPDGQPVAGATVQWVRAYFWGYQQTHGEYEWDSPQVLTPAYAGDEGGLTTRAAQDGSFRLEAAGKPTDMLIAVAVNHKPAMLKQPIADKPVKLVLKPLCQIIGHVVDAETGAPAEGMDVHAMRWSGSEDRKFYGRGPVARVAADGSYALRGLPCGGYYVLPASASSRWMRLPRGDKQFREVAPDEPPSEADFEVTEGARIIVHLTDEAGRPVTGAARVGVAYSTNWTTATSWLW